MFIADTCPVCGSSHRFCWPARIAPFIVDYVLSGESPDCKLCECSDCGLRYFDLRYTAEEMARLYDGYRGDRYVDVRRRHEHGYNNAAYTGDISARCAGVERFLLRCLGERYAGTVLDFGGDDGAFIPDFFQGSRLVFDVSNKPLVRGVERISDLESLQATPPRFVLLCHVLEHLPDTTSVLKQIQDLIPSGGKLYVEVPDERFRLRWLGESRFYKRWFDRLAQQHLAAPIVNFLVQSRLPVRAENELAPFGSRIRRKAVSSLQRMLPPIEDLALHEHTNFFTISSLEKLISQTGFRVIRTARESGVLRLLAERT